MKKYRSMLWLALCLGFAGNVAWGQDVNEGEDVVSDNDTAQIVNPGAVNMTTSEAFGQFLKAAKKDLGGLSVVFEGEDLEDTVLLMNVFLGQPLENETIESAFSLKKSYYDECPEVQFALSHLYEMALAAYFITGEHYWVFFPALLAEWYSKGLINTFAMNAIASHMSHAWVPGNNAWIDAIAKTVFYRAGIHYMKDSNLSTLVSQMTSDAFAYASSLLATEESES